MQPVARGKLRMAMTHAALVCDDPGAQRALPQLLIVGEAYMAREEERAVRTTLPRRTVLLRQKKGWMNADVMCWLAHQVQASLRAWQATHDIIFTPDAYRAHFTPRVLRAFAARSIRFYLPPAKATCRLPK